jgi:pectin methylesterase-like acyl-CoA thioesterase
MNKLALACALALAAFSLAGCNQQLQSDVTSTLAEGCPILAAVEASNPPLNKLELAAEATLANACPPHPAPTNAVVAVADVIAAYTALEPFIPRAQVASMNMKMQRIEDDLEKLTSSSSPLVGTRTSRRAARGGAVRGTRYVDAAV